MFHLDQKRLKKSLLNRIKKLNLIDLIFIGAFFALIFLFIVVFARSDQTIAVKLKVTDQNAFFLKAQPPDEYVYSFHQGDVERNEVGKIIAEVEGVTKYQTAPDTFTLYLDVNLKVNYNPLKKQYSYKGRPIIFGQDIEFEFGNTKVDGLIVDFPQFVKPESKQVKLQVETQLRSESRQFSDTYGMPKYYADAIKVGDVLTDNSGQEIMKVTAVKTSPAKRTIVTQGGQSVTIDDQNLIDIFYTVEMNAYEIEGKDYVYDYLPIQIGNAFPMITNTVSLWPTIISYQKL